MTEEEDKKKVFPFHEMGLDDRILKAIAKLGWVEPTLIQERAVPLIMEGKDLLARSWSCLIFVCFYLSVFPLLLCIYSLTSFFLYFLSNPPPTLGTKLQVNSRGSRGS